MGWLGAKGVTREVAEVVAFHPRAPVSLCSQDLV